MKKFNKFFSTVTAVMIASSIALVPMTLRGEETDDTDKKEKKNHTVEEVIELIDKKIEENNKKIEQNNKKIEENNKDIEQSKKRIEENNRKMEISKQKIEEAKRQEMEARNKLCVGLEKDIPLMKEYCSNNICDDKKIEILNKSINAYKEKCEKLMDELMNSATKEKKEKK